MGNIPASFIIVNQNEKSIYKFCKININENFGVELKYFPINNTTKLFCKQHEELLEDIKSKR